MAWRYYAQRAVSGLWLDNDVQLSEVELTWTLSGPGSAQATVPVGIGNLVAEDGSQVWGKFNTLLYAEEDGNLAWVGICTSASPDNTGLHLEFIGTSGWLQKIPFEGDYASWRVNVFDVVRMLVVHAETHKPAITHSVSTNNSVFFVGDPTPPAKPTPPARNKNESAAEWKASARYKRYLANLASWNATYTNHAKYVLGWYEAPYCGEEIDTLAREFGFEYRERYMWKDRGKQIATFYLDLSDTMVRRRTDIEFVDGYNLAKPLDTKDGSDEFANRVIALGAGEGRAMLRVTVGGDDNRLYQGIYVPYKTVRTLERLRSLAMVDHKILNSKAPKIESVEIWDIPGFAGINTLRVGDEVRIASEYSTPIINAWSRILSITRNPIGINTFITVEMYV